MRHPTVKPAGARAVWLSALVALLLVLAVLLALPPPAHGAFPGANGKIAFSNYPSIYSMNPDGSDLTRLTNDPTFASRDLQPAWSPDGTKIAFVRYIESPCCDREIYSMNADGSNQTRLTNDPADNTSPAWSPDGTKILYARTGGFPFDDIYVMNADGSGPAQVASQGTDPAWSPDGGKIAFAHQAFCTSLPCDNSDANRLYLMNPDGTGQVRIREPHPGGEFGPAWSPDGGKLVYWLNAVDDPDQHGGPHFDIGTVNPDGTNFVNLTLTPTPDEYTPAWSPDGQKITFARSPSIIIANPDGTGQTEVDPNLINDASEPDWQPLPTSSYPHPASAPQLDASLVPAFKQCGTGGNPSNAKHAPPLATGSCNPPRPGSVLAVVGTTSQSSAQITVVPGDSDPTNGNQANVSLTAALSDIQSASGGDYNPNASGADLTAVTRLRFTDKANGYGGLPATATEYDFKVPIDCSSTVDPSVGSSCSANTTANVLVPGLIQEQRQTVVQAFRVRVDDSGANGIRGDSDDRIFATQGVFVP